MAYTQMVMSNWLTIAKLSFFSDLGFYGQQVGVVFGIEPQGGLPLTPADFYSGIHPAPALFFRL